jgi:PKD repeat protein
LFRAVTLSLLAGVSAVPLLLTENAWAGQRQFLVILATSPKEYNGGLPPGGLPNPQLIRNQYFDTINPAVNSFAEYWKEISYGDITISGQVTDWLQLPWAIQPKTPMRFVDMDGDGKYKYGKGEKFNNQKAMVVVDINGNGPGGVDNGPRIPEDNPPYARGAGLTTSTGQPVWTAGERFLDMDGDGRWDGYDEARNAMDWNADDLPDLKGPWYDLNADNIALNAPNCIYLPDSDNDGNPDCCPNGPGTLGCEGIGPGGDLPADEACLPTFWTAPNATTFTDCNGNLIPDACDINNADSPACRATGFQCIPGPGLPSVCGKSKNQLPFTSGPSLCDRATVDLIPDECQYTDPDTDCVATVPTNCGPEAPDPCCGMPRCTALTGVKVRTPVARCEFDDGNGNRALDVVEPFENFLARVKLKADEYEGKPGYCIDRLSDATITDSFPGQGVNTVIARGTAKPIYGKHDPFGKLPRCYCDHPFNTTPCGTGGAPAEMCKAGEHAQYDPPDSWVEAAGSMKILVDRDPLVQLDLTTPEPPWYKQAWRDRYHEADPPPWNPKTPKVTLITSAAVTGRREFIADRGGSKGNGTGWTGVTCGTFVFPVEFMTAPCGDFEATCSPLGRILPEESNGVGRLILFDGGVEFDDLPSSKYHRAGDQQLGEVTSPFNTNIWGQDRGPNDPGGAGGLDKIIPAAGPYATHLHGQLGRDAGNQLLIELQTWLGMHCAGGVNLGQSCEVDGDCPGSTCTDGRCVGGVNVGDLCDGVVDCPGSTCVNGRCVGGANEDNFCDGVVDCPGSTCKKFGNDGAAWETEHGPHPFAGPSSGLNLGFHDYNLDGLIDLGEVVVAGTENYVDDPDHHTPRGSGTIYPWNRKRLLEDCIEVLDDVIDFDDLVDQVAMDAVTCGAPLSKPIPVPFQDAGPVNVAGICSGIVLLPAGAHILRDFLGATSFFDRNLFPIHNEDGLNDPAYTYAQFPTTGTRQLNWNLLFHDLVLALPNSPPIGAAGALTDYSAHEWLHTWEHFPDLYDYDIYDSGGVENCPMGAWDIMSRPANLVHPTPVLKEFGCTAWIEPVDLTTVLTPGVDKTITLPVAEFVRDDSYYFLENEDRLGERYWFWSAGNGFDQTMPMPVEGGVLIMHTDVGSNTDALPQQQRSGDRPAYMIVQADGRNDLLTCVNRGDAGDPWPGSSDNTHFACDTLPASEWYTENACTGLEVLDIAPDGSGSALVTFNWTPTSIPSLKFIDPPGGVSVGSIYQIRTEANDVYGGTTIRFYYKKKQDTGTPDFTGSTFISPQKKKTTPGSTELSIDWNISSGVPDGSYFIFADLIPGQGADGPEANLTQPRAGHNNQGTAKLETSDVIVNVTTIFGSTVTNQGTARSETWTIRCVDANAGKWFVGSSLTQPLPAEEPSAALCAANPTRCATTGTQYTSVAGAVAFTIKAGSGASPKGAVGDTFTFTTTGITSPSAAVTIRNGQIREDPTAIIDANPLSGPPPLAVSFDARGSIDPNGQPLQFRWTWGDGSPTETGAQKTHTFTSAGTFTVVLRATNPANSRYGEASVDIQMTNNSPNAVIKATPTSGGVQCGANPDGRCLTVRFSATESSDAETAPDQLIYQWDYGDGVTANDAKVAGILREPEHTYSRLTNGTLCTRTSPCTFTATLTVTDGGGKTDKKTVDIQVGNTIPVANISTTALSGSSPWTVTFNAKNSTDAENDAIHVKWTWGDNSPTETYPAKTGKPPATDGSVPHPFTLSGNQTSATFKVTALLCDRPFDGSGNCPGGQTQWPGVTVTVNTAVPGESNPQAIFCFQVGAKCETTAPTLQAGVAFTVDASRSFDNPTGGRISAYTWDWGDRTPLVLGVTQTHTYSAAGTYTIKLKVADGDTPANTGQTQRTVVVTQEGGQPPPPSTNHPPTAKFPQPTDAFVNAVVNFDARSSSDPDVGDVLHYRWVFGDGNQTQFTADPRTTHTYATPGSYLVRLTVRDAANASTDATQTVRVILPGENRSPVAMIATGPRTGSAPLTLTFDGSISFDPDGNAITSFTWEFRQNEALIETKTGPKVTRVFETAGEYTVELVVRDVDVLEGRSGREDILVTERSQQPPPEPQPPRPGPQEPPDSAAQRPVPGTCGVGMLMSVFGSLLGLTLTVVTRRRYQHQRP